MRNLSPRLHRVERHCLFCCKRTPQPRHIGVEQRIPPLFTLFLNTGSSRFNRSRRSVDSHSKRPTSTTGSSHDTFSLRACLPVSASPCRFRWASAHAPPSDVPHWTYFSTHDVRPGNTSGGVWRQRHFNSHPRTPLNCTIRAYNLNPAATASL
jgi:hypothetical protein